MDAQQALRRKLELLNEEHRELDSMIDAMLQESIVNQVAIQRCKKRKLLVRDQITRINVQLMPDIIA